MIRIVIEATGISPLLMHAFDIGDLIDQDKKKVAEPEEKSPRKQAERRLWTDVDGRPCIIVPALFKALVRAGQFHKHGKRQFTTSTSSLIPGIMTIKTGVILLKTPKPWEVDVAAITTARGGRQLCYRPRFDEWSFKFELMYDEMIVSQKAVRPIVDDALGRIGIGSFRPERMGPYGRSVVTLWKPDKGDPLRETEDLKPKKKKAA